MRWSALKCRCIQWFVLAAIFLACAALLATPLALSQDGAKDDIRALRKDPQYTQLMHDGKAFLAIAPEKQDAMRKLHEDLEKLAPAEREWLKDGLKRYADWLEKLPETEQQQIASAPDLQTRLQRIQDLREKEWLQRQPKAIREALDKHPKSKQVAGAMVAASAIGMLSPAPRQLGPLVASLRVAAAPAESRADKIKRLKQEESRRAREWLVTKRHWTEVTDTNAKTRPTMPTHPADFGNKDVTTFITQYMRKALSKEEQERLDKVEGRWPQYPLTLVDLADKHPLALPQAHGPENFAQLPIEVRIALGKETVIDLGKAKGKDPKKGKDKFDKGEKIDVQLRNEQRLKEQMKDADKRLTALGLQNPTEAMKFAYVAANLVHKNGVKLPYELWAAKVTDMAPPMQVFLHEQGPFWPRLATEDKKELLELHGKWPEYPLKVEELAAKHGFRPPWQTLPEVGNKTGVWDKYRVKPLNKIEVPPALKQKVEEAALGLDAPALDPKLMAPRVIAGEIPP